MDEFEKYYNRALRFLSYRPRSEKEVRDNLRRVKSRRGRKKVEEVDESLIDQVIQKLKEQKFLNDDEFAKWWIEQRTTVRPRSFRVIKIELRQKGIANDISESQMSNAKFQMTNESTLVRKLIEKRLPRYQGLDRKVQWEKLAGFLGRRGFDYDTIKSALDEVVGKGYNHH